MESSPQGITSNEASLRLMKYGSNELEEKEKKPVWYLFLNQFDLWLIKKIRGIPGRLCTVGVPGEFPLNHPRSGNFQGWYALPVMWQSLLN